MRGPQDKKVPIDLCLLIKSHSLALYSYKMIQLVINRLIIPPKVTGTHQSV